MQLVMQMRADRQKLQREEQQHGQAAPQRMARQSVTPTKWPKPFQTAFSQPTRAWPGKNGKCKWHATVGLALGILGGQNAGCENGLEQ